MPQPSNGHAAKGSRRFVCARMLRATNPMPFIRASAFCRRRRSTAMRKLFRPPASPNHWTPRTPCPSSQPKKASQPAGEDSDCQAGCGHVFCLLFLHCGISSHHKEFKLRLARFSSALFILPCLSACSSQQLYGAGQAWQRNECNKIIDSQERNRCMASTNTSYEDYKRQADEARGAK